MSTEIQNELQEPTDIQSSLMDNKLTLYAIMDNEGEIISVNKRKIHLTRRDVRIARDTYNRRNAKIVKGHFILESGWTSAK
jgi:ribosome-associated protein YbcJ (S4-like RNA binding protein)